MSKLPLLSVVMTVYNEADRLPTTLESIRRQTFTDYELIIIDDSSKDNTWQILSSIDHPRLRIHRNIPNRGQTASLKSALSLASGQYIARHDAQDSSDPDRFKKQLNYLKRHPSTALIGSQIDWVDAAGGLVRHFDYPTVHAEIVERMKTKNSFGHGAVMMRRDAFSQVGGYREEFRLAQDYDLWLRLSEKFEVANLKDTLYKMRFSSRMASVARNAEQSAYAALARQLAIERAEHGHEMSNLEEAVQPIRKRFERQNLFARQAERGRNFINWANRLLWWGDPASQYAWPMWSYAVTAWPFNLEVWKFLARQIREQLSSPEKASA